MAYNHGKAERRWRLWKEKEEKILRECGVDEETIEEIRTFDREEFNSDRRFYTRLNDVGEYIAETAMQEPPIVMLNQAASDREKLAKLLNISKEQMSYVTNADAGCGLIRYGSALVPFINRFPRDTKLYELMTTKPGEGVFGGEKEAM